MVNPSGRRPLSTPARQKSKPGAVRRAPARRDNNIQRMQYAQKAKKFTKVDPSERWGQTPASSNQLAPRGFGYYDAFSEDAYSAITAMSIGPATPITAKCVAPIIITRAPKSFISGPQLEAGFSLLVIYPSASEVLMRIYLCGNTSAAQDPDDPCITHNYSAPALQADPPESAIPTRCSVSLKNISEHFTMGGDIYTLRCTTGLTLIPQHTTNFALASFAEDVRVHARSKNYDGVELKASHQKNCTVVDQSKATWFDNWGVSHSAEDQPWLRTHLVPGASSTDTVDAFTNGIHNPSFTPIVILFDPFVSGIASSGGSAAGNSYRVIAQAQYLAHYPQGGMLANLAVEPRASATALEKHRAAEAVHGSNFHKLADIASRVIQTAWKHRQQIATAGRIGFKLMGR